MRKGLAGKFWAETSWVKPSAIKARTVRGDGCIFILRKVTASAVLAAARLIEFGSDCAAR
jgi:hypothetical protein